jgi:hypothetical protein
MFLRNVKGRSAKIHGVTFQKISTLHSHSYENLKFHLKHIFIIVISMLSVSLTHIWIPLTKVATNLMSENETPFTLNCIAKSLSRGLVTETSNSNAITFTELGTDTT